MSSSRTRRPQNERKHQDQTRQNRDDRRRRRQYNSYEPVYRSSAYGYEPENRFEDWKYESASRPEEEFEYRRYDSKDKIRSSSPYLQQHGAYGFGQSGLNYSGTDLARGSELDSGRVQFRGRGPKNYKRSDERIREDICERLMDDEFVDPSEIEVEVKDGEVFLKGKVEDRETKFRIERICDSVAGVLDVSNQLRVGRSAKSESEREGRFRIA